MLKHLKKLFSRSGPARSSKPGPGPENPPLEATLMSLVAATGAPENGIAGESGEAAGPGSASDIRRMYASNAPGPAKTTEPRHETVESLARSLEWRTQVLLKLIREHGYQEDSTAVVQSLKRGANSFVRQLPTAAQKALAVCRNPNSTIQDLVELFENDPTLTQALLKRANSAWYHRGGEKLASIFPAVSRIGAKAVESLLVEKVLHGLVSRPGKAFGPIVETIWDDMIRFSRLSRSMAGAFGVDPERAYVLALLSDVGKLIVFDHISDLRKGLHREVSLPGEFLVKLLDHVHEPLSGLAALRWGMGGEAAYVISHHHRHPVPETGEPFTELLYVADSVMRADDAPPDWDAIWTAGGITRERAAIQSRYAGMVLSEVADEPEDEYRDAA